MADDDATLELRLRMARNVLRALWLAGEDLGGRAQRLAPLEEGTLSGSMAVVMIVNGTRHEGDGALAAATNHVERLVRARRGWTADVEVSFNTVYAARQHEETTWQHIAGRQAKYLEQPFREQLGRYERVIATAARASM